MKWNGRLPESELELMLAVWEAGEEGATAPGILARLERPLTASALHSYLKRLEEKGFLSCGKEGKTNRYRARVSRAEYEQQESRTVLDRLYAGSLRRFAAALHDGGSLTEEEVRELEEYLRTLRRMRITFSIIRQSVINYVRQVIHIQSSRSHIRCNQ